jgi:hypothetical protein
MSIKGMIEDIQKGKEGRAVAHVGGADVGFRRNGGFEGGPGGGIHPTKLREAIMLNIANNGRLDIKDANGDKEVARATAKTFRLKAIDRLIADLEKWGSGFPDKMNDAKSLKAYKDKNPDVFM